MGILVCIELGKELVLVLSVLIFPLGSYWEMAMILSVVFVPLQDPV